MTVTRSSTEFTEVAYGNDPSALRASTEYVEVIVGPAAATTITDVFPTSGCPGETVTLTGTGFGGAPGSVTLVDGAANPHSPGIISWSETSIVIVVPQESAAGVGTVAVQTSNGTDTDTFTVLPCGQTIADPTGRRIGCGDYRVFIQTTGGSDVLAELAWSTLTLGRRLDEMSQASVSGGTEQDAECIATLGTLEPFGAELSIWRDGFEEWVGPIVRVSHSYAGIRLEARDLFQWFERRILPFDRSFIQTDVAQIAAQYVDDALYGDASPNISVAISNTGVLADRAVVATLRRRAADELRELSRTGLDFTAVARTIRFGGEEIPTVALVTLTEDTFEVADASYDGLEMGNHIFVQGASTGSANTPIEGEAGGQFVPLIQQVYSEPSILDANSADQAATTRLDLLRSAPLLITGRLLEDAPVPFRDVVPGARVDLRQQIGFAQIIADMRLLAMEVSASASDSGVSEIIRLTLEPIGTIQ